ncbi:MAG: hypothetical protein ABI995_01390, partial [Acidobacteriota bacterium]
MKAPSVPSFRFDRPKADGPIHVLNANSYLMAEYNQRTGKVTWQRLVLATEKNNIERWLAEHYPAPAASAQAAG